MATSQTENHMPDSIEAIILRTYASGESDLVLRVLSSNGLKYSLLAKHARKSKRRFSSSFDIFDRGTFRIRHSSSHLAWVESFAAKPCLHKLREDLNKLTLASLLSECFDSLIKEGSHENPKLFRALELSLQTIAESESLKDSLHAGFAGITALLKLSGFLCDQEELSPSKKNLEKLLSKVEFQVEKKLLTHNSVHDLLGQLVS